MKFRFITLFILLGFILSTSMAICADITKGNLRYTITVSKFQNESGFGGWDVGNSFSTTMTEALQASGKFIVLGDKEMRNEAMDEQDFAASGRVAKGKKTPQIGRMTPAQLLVRGAITNVQEVSGGGGGFNVMGVDVGGSRGNAEINITIYLVDSTTGQVKASKKVVGKSSNTGLSLGYWGGFFGGNVEGFKKDNVGKACEDALAQAVEFLSGQLDKIPWEGTVQQVSADKIILNRGSREGVSNGMRFKVGTANDIVDQDTGELLDRDMTQIGVIEVTTVKEKLSYCKPISGGNKIEKGMTVFPAN